MDQAYLIQDRGAGHGRRLRRVNLAIFARPHVMEEIPWLIMPHRLTHNLQSNPQAAYLFLEAAPAMRLYLMESRIPTLYSLRRPADRGSSVSFRSKVLPGGAARNRTRSPTVLTAERSQHDHVSDHR